MTATFTGRCLCGGARFAFDGPPGWVFHCHCESCRRQTASAFTTFVNAPAGRWRWTGAAPASFASSPGVRRFFCGACGSPLAFTTDRRPGEADFYLALLDDPADVAVEGHDRWAERVGWLTLHDDLPRQ